MAVKVKEIIVRYEEEDGAAIKAQGANSIEDYKPLTMVIHHHMAPPPPPEPKPEPKKS